MVRKFVSYVSSRTIRAVASIIMVGILLFFAATRTQYGRDRLSHQIEVAFSKSFSGSLRIGKLTGNLLNTLYATDVELSDEDGSPIIRIDSVIIEPRWMDLLQREFSVRNITLYNPNVRLAYTETGSLNLLRALGSTRPAADSTGSTSADDEPGWSFRSATIHVEHGRIETTNSAEPPPLVSSGVLFDYSNEVFNDINVEARVDWFEPVRVIDVLHFSAESASSDLQLTDGQTQFLIDDERITVNDFGMSLGATSLALRGWFDLPARNQAPVWTHLPFELQVLPGTIDFDGLRRLFPKMQLADSGRFSSFIRGPLDDLSIASLELSDGTASILVNGSIQGLPSRADFDLSLSSSSLTPTRLREWWPESKVDQILTMDSLSLSSFFKGFITLDSDTARTSATGNAEIRSSKGTLSTSFEFDGPISDSLQFDFRLSSSGVDPEYWTGNKAYRGSINGSIRLSGSGLWPSPERLQVSSDFTDFRLGRIFIPQLSFTARSDSSSFQASLTGNQLDGNLKAELHGRYTRPDPTINLHVSTGKFDLGQFLSIGDLSTSLNLNSDLRGAGSTIDNFAGVFELAMDSSRVVSSDRASVIPRHTVRMIFREETASSARLSVRGDILTMDVRKNIPFDVLRTFGSAWIQNAAAAVRRSGDKPLYTSDISGSLSDDLEEALRWQSLSDAVDNNGLSYPLSVHVDATILRPDILTSYFPGIPTISTSGQATLNLEWLPSSIRVDMNYEADSLSVSSVRLAHSAFEGHFSASSSVPIEESSRIAIEVSADSMTAGGQQIFGPSLEISYAKRNGKIILLSRGTGPLDSLVVDATLSVLPDRARLHFETIRAQSRNAFWSLMGASDIEWYSDALLVNDIQLIQRNRTGPTGQSFRVHGRLSNLPSDTLHVEAHDVVLHELSNFAKLKPHFGGLLNARLAVTRDIDRPTISGSIGVERMSVDSWIIGDVFVRSSLIPGSPDVDVGLQVQPVDSLTDAFIYGTELPGVIVENRLDVQGTLRLPEQDKSGIKNNGALNLKVNADRTDMFFFEYIFNEIDHVSGYISGDGSITGTLQSPIFDINLGLRDGRFEVPVINLSYEIESVITVDSEAIRVRSGTITDPTGGTATIGGSLLFNNYRFFTLNLASTLDEFQIMDVASSKELPFYGYLWASGNLTVEGPLFDASMRSSNAVMTPNSELFIPVVETAISADVAYIVYEDSLGYIPDFKRLASRSFLLATRPDAERRFLDALDMDLSILAPEGSTLHLVIDPLLADVINARVSGRIELQRIAGDFSIFGTLDVSAGDYLFTAGEVFVRRFLINPGGTITWDGDPINAALNIPASYRTRASTAGLTSGRSNSRGLIPLLVSLQITGTVEAPEVALGLAIDRSNQSTLGDYQAIEARLNAPDKASEYATSVLLTNSFLLTTENVSSGTGSQLAFNSVSQLVSTQLNRFVNEALPNVDFTFGLQGQSTQDLDVTYGVALRLLDEKLIIRGQGLYQGSNTGTRSDGSVSSRYEGIQGEFIVEVKLSPTVSVEGFFRREGDIFENAGLTDTSGAGISYQTEFSTWKRFWHRLFGWLSSSKKEPDDPPKPAPASSR